MDVEYVGCVRTRFLPSTALLYCRESTWSSLELYFHFLGLFRSCFLVIYKHIYASTVSHLYQDIFDFRYSPPERRLVLIVTVSCLTGNEPKTYVLPASFPGSRKGAPQNVEPAGVRGRCGWATREIRRGLPHLGSAQYEYCYFLHTSYSSCLSLFTPIILLLLSPSRE